MSGEFGIVAAETVPGHELNYRAMLDCLAGCVLSTYVSP